MLIGNSPDWRTSFDENYPFQIDCTYLIVGPIDGLIISHDFWISSSWRWFKFLFKISVMAASSNFSSIVSLSFDISSAYLSQTSSEKPFSFNRAFASLLRSFQTSSTFADTAGLSSILATFCCLGYLYFETTPSSSL